MNMYTVVYVLLHVAFCFGSPDYILVELSNLLVLGKTDVINL